MKVARTVLRGGCRREVAFLPDNLGLRTIAEGVETVEQLDFLRAQGCHEIQGYYFSTPLPVDQFLTLLEQHPQKINQNFTISK